MLEDYGTVLRNKRQHGQPMVKTRRVWVKGTRVLQVKSGTAGGFRNVLGLVGLGRSTNTAEMNMMMRCPEDSGVVAAPIVSVQPALGDRDNGRDLLDPPPPGNQSLLTEIDRMGESLNISEILPPPDTAAVDPDHLLSTPIHRPSMSLFNFLGKKRPKEDFLKSDAKKMKLASSLPAVSRPLGLRLLNRSDSGLDKSGIDKTRVPCGTRLAGDTSTDENFSPMKSLDGNVSLLLLFSSPTLISPPVVELLGPEENLPESVIGELDPALQVGVSLDVPPFPQDKDNGGDDGVGQQSACVSQDSSVDFCKAIYVDQGSVSTPVVGIAAHGVDDNEGDVGDYGGVDPIEVSQVGVDRIPQVDGPASDEEVVTDIINKDFTNYPVLLCTNLRSLIPKIDCLCDTISEEQASISFLSELWLQGKNPLHQIALDRKLNLEGLEFFSNSRAAKRGGGVGIVVNKNHGFSGKKLQVNSRVGPSSLEAVWVLVTPPTPVNGVSKYICACI